MKTVLTSVLSRLRALFHRHRLEREMLEEMRLHLEALRDDFISDGMTPEEARCAALKRFGGLAQLEERCRDEHGFAWVGQTWKDLRFTLRSLRQAKLYALAVVLSLVFGAGVAAVAATFTLWAFATKRPWGAERLFLVGSSQSKTPGQWVRWGVDFAELQARHTAIADFVAAGEFLAKVEVERGPPFARITQLTPGCFEFFGITPRLGRGLRAADYLPGAKPVVVIGYVPWLRIFNGDEQALGRTLRIDGQDCRLVGVLDSGSPFPSVMTGHFYVPYVGQPDPGKPFEQRMIIAARLHPGVTPLQANARLALAPPVGLGDDARPFFAAHPPVLVPIDRVLNHDVNNAILVGGVLLYLIACLNVVNLGLVRLLARWREFAIRLSLGGSRRQVMRLLLLEHGILASVAVALLLLFFRHGANLVFAAITGDPNLRNAFFLEPFHLCCIFGGTALAMLTAIVVSALRLRRVHLGAALKEGDSSGGESRRMKRRRNALMIAQATLAVVLMTATGLMALSLARIMHADFGFDSSQRLKVWLAFPRGHPSDAADRRPYFEKLWAQLASRPEIAGHSIGQDAMLPGSHRNTTPVIAPDGSVIMVAGCSADANLGDNLGLRLHSGRWLSNLPGTKETVLTENLAARLFPASDPLGRKVHSGAHGETALTVVGVVQDVRDTLREPTGFRLFLPLWMDPSRIETMILRLAGPMRPKFDYEIFEAIRGFDPEVIPAFVSPIQELLQPAISRELYVLRALCGFAGIGYVLALVALFATTAYTVESRMHEYGIRLALGSTPRALRLHVLGQGMACALYGLGLGTVLAGGLTWLMRELLFQTSGFEPVVSLVIAVLLAAATLLASLRAALRAGRANPAALLKAE